MVLTIALSGWNGLPGWPLLISQMGKVWARKDTCLAQENPNSQSPYKRYWLKVWAAMTSYRKGIRRGKQKRVRRGVEGGEKKITHGSPSPSPRYFPWCLLTLIFLWFVCPDAWWPRDRGRTTEKQRGTKGMWNPQELSGRRMTLVNNTLRVNRYLLEESIFLGQPWKKGMLSLHPSVLNSRNAVSALWAWKSCQEMMGGKWQNVNNKSGWWDYRGFNIFARLL